MGTINESGGDSKLHRDVFDEVFEMWWPKLEVAIKKAFTMNGTMQHENLRSERELLEETLQLVRSLSRFKSNGKLSASIPEGLVIDMLGHIDKIIIENNSLLNYDVNNSVMGLLKISRFLSLRSNDGDNEEIGSRIEDTLGRQSGFIAF